MYRGRSGPLPFQQGRGGGFTPGRGHEYRGQDFHPQQFERDQLLTGDPKQAWSVGRDQWQMGRGKFAIGLPTLSIAQKGSRLKSLDELTEDELRRCGLITNSEFDDAEPASNIQYVAPIPSPQLTPTHLSFDSDDDNEINNNENIGEDELLMRKKKRKRDEDVDTKQQADINTRQDKEAENNTKVTINKVDQQKSKGIMPFSPKNLQNNYSAQNSVQNAVQMKIDKELKIKINRVNNIFDSIFNLNKAVQIDINSTAHALQTLGTQRKKAELLKKKNFEDKVINLKDNQFENDPIRIAMDLIQNKGSGASRLQMVCIDDRGWKQKAAGIKLEPQSQKTNRQQQEQKHQQQQDPTPSRSPPHIQANKQYNQNNSQYSYNNSQGRGSNTFNTRTNANKPYNTPQQQQGYFKQQYPHQQSYQQQPHYDTQSLPYPQARPQSQPIQVQHPQIHYPRAQTPQNIVPPHQYNTYQHNQSKVPPSSHSQPIQGYDAGRGTKRRREYE